MQVKEFLENIRCTDMLIDSKIQQIKRIRESLCYAGVCYDGEKVQSSRNPDKFTDGVAKIIELEKMIDADIDTLVDNKRQAREMIETLDSIVEKTILYKRYFENNSFDDIAVVMNYSVRRVYQIHADAIGKLTLQFFSL